MQEEESVKSIYDKAIHQKSNLNIPPLIPFLSVSLCSFYILYYFSQEGLEVGSKLRRQINQAIIENWTSCPSSHYIQEISPKPKSLNEKFLKPLIRMLLVKCFNIAICIHTYTGDK